MSRQLYTIEELAEAADVTPRTIRYYTAEGLLPPPEARGRHALYTDEHLNRLRLISRLKETFLPLAKIKEQVEQLTEEHINELLADETAALERTQEAQSAKHKASRREPDASDSAAEYIARVLRSRQHAAMRPSWPVNASPTAPAAPGNTWERVPLLPGVELHVRHPHSPKVRDLVQKLIAYAKTLGKQIHEEE